MSRPEYEREEHRQTEAAIKQQVEALHGVSLHKSPRYYEIDYFVTKNGSKNIIAWVEIRGKEFNQHSYPTFYTSLMKFISVARMSHMTGKPAYIIAVWKDYAGFYKCEWQDTRRFEIKIGGRTTNSRGDAQDIEPVIHIPVDEFKPLTDITL